MPLLAGIVPSCAAPQDENHTAGEEDDEDDDEGDLAEDALSDWNIREL